MKTRSAAYWTTTILIALALLGIAATSWAPRPAARRLGAAPDRALSPIADRREILKAA